MNPVLRELQRQLNDIAKQLDALQRQETVLSNPVTYSGTPTAGAVAYWTGAGTVAHASFGTAEVVRTSGDQTATGTKTFSDGLQVGGDGSFGSLLEVIGTGSDIASFEVDGTFARVYFVSYRESALTHGEFKGRAARGSKASPSAIQSGDLLFAIRAEGYGTNAWPGGNTAEVSLEADGAHTNTSQPGRVVFKTAKSGATGSTEAMRIDSSQRVSMKAALNTARATATIAAGAITYAATYMRLDTEGAAATDDLTDINGGTDGDIIILRTTDTARDVVIKNSGNIRTGGAVDRTLGTRRATWMGMYSSDDSAWLELAYSAK